MAIPTNLLPINPSLVQEPTETTLNNLVPQSSIVEKVPNNLLPLNTSNISSSFQAFVGILPTTDVAEIPQFTILNSIIPDGLFTTGSIEQIRIRTSNAINTYINGLPTLPAIPTIPTLVVGVPRIPSYGQIKNYIKTKIDRIKFQRQQASVKALREELKKRENPFTYRQTLKNQQELDTFVLGRFNNQQR